MSRVGGFRGIAGVIALLFALSCTEHPAAPAPTVVRVRQLVLFGLPTLKVGDTARLAVTMIDSAGRGVDGRRPQWSTSNPAVVLVDSTGFVRAVGRGVANVVAIIDGLRAEIRVLVDPATASLEAASSGSPSGATTQDLRRSAGISAGSSPEWNDRLFRL